MVTKNYKHISSHSTKAIAQAQINKLRTWFPNREYKMTKDASAISKLPFNLKERKKK